MSTMMQSIIKGIKQTYDDYIKQIIYRQAALCGGLLHTGNIFSRVPTKIASDELTVLQNSQSLEKIVPTNIARDDLIRNRALQNSQSLEKIVPTNIASDNLIRNEALQNLQSQKKLCLVLDLDHTLLHSKLIQKISPDEKKKLDNFPNKDDIYRYKSPEFDRVIKLRPFVRKFLEEANKLFEMYIYTMGVRDYALHAAALLDPDSIYFGSRIISRENGTLKGQKGLDVVPVDESGVIILDDREMAWARHLSNLIVINRYDYFAPKVTNNTRSLLEEGMDGSEKNDYFAPKVANTTRSILEEGRDESESAGPLSCVLKLLQKVHKVYFGQSHMLDVRVLLGSFKQQLGDENCLCAIQSRKRLRVRDECSSSHNVAKKQKC